MNRLKKIVILVMSLVATASCGLGFGPAGTDIGTWVPITPGETRTWDVVDYVNFSATVSADSANNYTITRSYYTSWTPDNQGTRPYHCISFYNTSSTQSATFYIRSFEPVPRMQSVYTDNKLWIVSTGRYGEPTAWTLFDDDHGYGYGFGAKITLEPGTSIDLTVSMYSSTSIRNWFGIELNTSDPGLDPNYPEAIMHQDGTLTRINF